MCCHVGAGIVCVRRRMRFSAGYYVRAVRMRFNGLEEQRELGFGRFRVEAASVSEGRVHELPAIEVGDEVINSKECPEVI